MMEKKIVEITNGRLWYEGLEGMTFLVYDNLPGSLIIAEDWDRDDGNHRIIGRHDCRVVENHVNIAALASLDDIAAEYGLTSSELIKDITNYKAVLVWPNELNLFSCLKTDPAQVARQIKKHMTSDNTQELIRILSGKEQVK